MSDDKYEQHINAVLSECPEASREEVKAAFEKYESEFYIPPQDALRSIIRRFKGEMNPISTTSNSLNQTPKVSKKVASLTELTATDRDIEIEVEIISHNLREQTIRGEQKQIAFGLLEDNPWGDGGQRNRWEFKDWGPNSNIVPGSVVRIEGASVNEYQGRMSLNINQTTRISILREGTRPVIAPGEPIGINNLPKDGYVCVLGRVLSVRPDQIHKKDGSGSIDVVRGRIADESGTIGFLSWEPFGHEVGSLVKIDGAQVRTFRETPELNFGKTTKVELYHDSNFADTDSLMQNNVLTISQLSDGSRDVETVVQITEWAKRSFVRDGEEKFLWSGQIADLTGKCRMSAWEELPIKESELPITVKLKGVRVRSWQGIPDITVDNSGQVEILDSTPWDDSIDLSTHVIEVPLTELVNGSSRVGISTEGIVASVRDDCGIIMRCTQCRRVLRDGSCNEHGDDEGNQDVRLRVVIDDGVSTSSLLINKEASLNLLNISEDDLKSQIKSNGQVEFVQSLRSKLLLADKIELVVQDPALIATELRTKWGVM
jgi:ssDNA-binding replication factor A large subunit